MTKTCDNCIFWYGGYDEDEGGYEIGECRRFPPVFVGEKTEYIDSWDYPKTYGKSDCGEFKEKN